MHQVIFCTNMTTVAASLQSAANQRLRECHNADYRQIILRPTSIFPYPSSSGSRSLRLVATVRRGSFWTTSPQLSDRGITFVCGRYIHTFLNVNVSFYRSLKCEVSRGVFVFSFCVIVMCFLAQPVYAVISSFQLQRHRLDVCVVRQHVCIVLHGLGGPRAHSVVTCWYS